MSNPPITRFTNQLKVLPVFLLVLTSLRETTISPHLGHGARFFVEDASKEEPREALRLSITLVAGFILVMEEGSCFRAFASLFLAGALDLEITPFSFCEIRN
jgi:hypothetical protein